MTNRDTAPAGAPCWADLWTSDVEGAGRFYGELFGWKAEEPSAEFGGYFMFTRNGVPVAGGQGDMGDAKANNAWKVYLASPDINKTTEVAEAEGAQAAFPPMAVADLGSQTVLSDPAGNTVGVWQPVTFPGFTTLSEPGTPAWFELHTADFDRSVAFYRTTFGWETDALEGGGMNYVTVRDPSGAPMPMAGVLDIGGHDDHPAGWWVYWAVEDTDASVAKVRALGGSVLMEPFDSPYGRMAVVTDPYGAQFRLNGPNTGA